MDDSSQSLNEVEVLQLAGMIAIGAIIAVFIVVTFVFLLHCYAKWYWSRDEDPVIFSWRLRQHWVAFEPVEDQPAIAAQRQGLESSVLRSLPIVVYNPRDFKEGLECAVCLCELSEGEKARQLPKCNHGFHVDCIDKWFQSHSTCPLCRNPLNPQPSLNTTNIEIRQNFSHSSSEESSHFAGHSTESIVFPTNVLFWGNQSQVNSLGLPSEEGQDQSVSSATAAAAASAKPATNTGRLCERLVIDIPSDGCSLSSPSAVPFAAAEAQSPMATPLRSLKRFLSRGKMVASTSCGGSSSRNAEQA
ncbi:hypothetical protein Nepgr_016024 [Nepenthes gracilis]|uniref:RING-type E3 ubiquitin transferase n=1 Tax=Nepenthes gracilis TaxID=150966 RepID=A0AAD3SMR8_NEPGR|nr:hypothetical protein Nepgr_016024 [Nepenthes gracilis]